MAGSTSSLLRDWKLLERQVIPPLLEVRNRPARAWSIGTTEDAVAVAVAYQHAQADDDDRTLESFSREPAGGFDVVSFPLAALRCIPADARAECFVHDRAGWVPSPDVAEQVVIGDPVAPVDLVTVRISLDLENGEINDLVDEAVEKLRSEGHLLLTGAPPPKDVPVDALHVVGKSSSASAPARLYRKHSGIRCRRSGRARPSGETSKAPRAPKTLARRARQSKLVENHVRLARSLARRFEHRGEPADDLEQVAMLGLIKAAHRFDENRDAAFSTYATVSILGELKRHFRDKTWMLRVPRSTQELYLAVKEARELLTHELGANPSIDQIAAHLGCGVAEVSDALRAADNFWPMSLDAGSSDEEGGGPVEVPVVDENLTKALDLEQLRRVLPRLDRRERFILRRLYFDGWTQRRIADDIGISQMQVSRVSSAAHAKLRSWVEASEFS